MKNQNNFVPEKLSIGKHSNPQPGLKFIEVGVKKSYSIGDIVHPKILVIEEYRIFNNSTSLPLKDAQTTAKMVVASADFYQNSVGECMCIESALRNIHDGVYKDASQLISLLETMLNCNKSILKTIHE